MAVSFDIVVKNSYTLYIYRNSCMSTNVYTILYCISKHEIFQGEYGRKKIETNKIGIRKLNIVVEHELKKKNVQPQQQ